MANVKVTQNGEQTTTSGADGYAVDVIDIRETDLIAKTISLVDEDGETHTFSTNTVGHLIGENPSDDTDPVDPIDPMESTFRYTLSHINFLSAAWQMASVTWEAAAGIQSISITGDNIELVSHTAVPVGDTSGVFTFEVRASQTAPADASYNITVTLTSQTGETISRTRRLALSNSAVLIEGHPVITAQLSSRTIYPGERGSLRVTADIDIGDSPSLLLQASYDQDFNDIAHSTHQANDTLILYAYDSYDDLIDLGYDGTEEITFTRYYRIYDTDNRVSNVESVTWTVRKTIEAIDFTYTQDGGKITITPRVETTETSHVISRAEMDVDFHSNDEELRNTINGKELVNSGVLSNSLQPGTSTSFDSVDYTYYVNGSYDVRIVFTGRGNNSSVYPYFGTYTHTIEVDGLVEEEDTILAYDETYNVLNGALRINIAFDLNDDDPDDPYLEASMTQSNQVYLEQYLQTHDGNYARTERRYYHMDTTDSDNEYTIGASDFPEITNGIPGNIMNFRSRHGTTTSTMKINGVGISLIEYDCDFHWLEWYVAGSQPTSLSLKAYDDSDNLLATFTYLDGWEADRIQMAGSNRTNPDTIYFRNSARYIGGIFEVKYNDDDGNEQTKYVSLYFDLTFSGPQWDGDEQLEFRATTE